MIGVWADDLSGALDTGVVFGRHMPTQVWSQLPVEKPLKNGAMVVNANTRHLTPSGVFERYRTIPASVLSADRHYLKVDSTLRGPVGASITALLNRLPQYRGALLCSAFPKNHRIIVKGRLLVDSQPAHHTALADDPKNPLTTDNIADVLRATTEWPLVTVPTTAFGDTDWSQTAIFIADATCTTDLEQLADILVAHPNLLPVGSAGWAAVLAARWKTTPPPDAEWGTFDGILAVVGSRHPVSRRQVGQVRNQADWSISKGDGTVMARHHIFMTPEPNHDHPEQALEKLAETAAQVLTKSNRRVLVVSTGGDTTLALTRHLNIETLLPLTELEPGIVLSRSLGNRRPIYLISKSGGFGSPHFFPNLAQTFIRMSNTASSDHPVQQR